MRLLIEIVFAFVLVVIMSSCASRVLVKDCQDIDGDIKDCELIKKL